jgi:hypothetical protein
MRMSGVSIAVGISSNDFDVELLQTVPPLFDLS